MKDVHEVLGDEVFYAVCKVGITDLKKYLTPVELEKVMSIDNTGKRSVKFSQK